MNSAIHYSVIYLQYNAWPIPLSTKLQRDWREVFGSSFHDDFADSCASSVENLVEAFFQQGSCFWDTTIDNLDAFLKWQMCQLLFSDHYVFGLMHWGLNKMLTFPDNILKYISFKESNSFLKFVPKSLSDSTCKIKCTLAGYKIVDHSDVIGASPVGAAPTTSSFST